MNHWSNRRDLIFDNWISNHLSVETPFIRVNQSRSCIQSSYLQFIRWLTPLSMSLAIFYYTSSTINTVREAISDLWSRFTILSKVLSDVIPHSAKSDLDFWSLSLTILSKSCAAASSASTTNPVPPPVSPVTPPPPPMILEGVRRPPDCNGTSTKNIETLKSSVTKKVSSYSGLPVITLIFASTDRCWMLLDKCE